MAVKDEYTLADFTEYAHKTFPDAFEIVADPSLYKFEINRVCTARSGVKEFVLLHVSFWNGPHHGIPVWASLDGNHVQYSYGKPGSTIVSTQGPFPAEGYCPIKGHVAPFQLIAEHSWPSGKQTLATARALTRKRLALLVRFDFLMAGHIGGIRKKTSEDLLMNFKDVCMHMQQRKEAIAEEKRKREEQLQRWAEERERQSEANANIQFGGRVKEEMEVKNDTITRFDDAQFVDIEQEESGKRAKRVAIDMTDDPTETGFQRPHKRPRTIPVLFRGRTVDSDTHQSSQPSPQLQDIFDTLIDQCRSEEEKRWTEEKTALQESDRKLRTQLADEQKKTQEAEVRVEEWKEKYQNLKDKLARLMGDD